jgi:hypothetical protein
MGKKFAWTAEQITEHYEAGFVPEDDDDDDFDNDPASECGQLSDGTCMMAGTEFCDWECPIRGQ